MFGDWVRNATQWSGDGIVSNHVVDGLLQVGCVSKRRPQQVLAATLSAPGWGQNTRRCEASQKAEGAWMHQEFCCPRHENSAITARIHLHTE
jgi:hypothetical protein